MSKSTNTIQNINVEQFTRTLWQQKPIVIKDAFPQFKDLLDEHELAGLAMEEDFDSRIISNDKGQWRVTSGPFDEFEEVCVNDWTLLVQGVEQAIPDATTLLEQFHFIPSWRLDDLMVSFSVANAGVGPHVDQYDVFIIQGKGSRRWQVGEKIDETTPTLLPHPKLKQIPMFTPIIDEVLQPGDMIYIPPGFPHNGVAIEDCINYSVGFRAPNQTEILSSFTDFLIDNQINSARYADPEIAKRQYPGEILPKEQGQFRQLTKQMIDSDQFLKWLVAFQTITHHEAPEYSGLDDDISEVFDALNSGKRFTKQPYVNVAHTQSETTPDRTFFGVNGMSFEVHAEDVETLCLFLYSQEWHNDKKIFFKNGSHFVQIVSKLVNEGCWIIS